MISRREAARQQGRSLRVARTIAGLTPQELAARAGIPRSTIAAYEAGRNLMPPEVRARLLAALADADPDLPGAA